MVVTLDDMVVEGNTNVVATYPDFTFREWDDCVQRAVQYAPTLSVIDNPEVPGIFDGEIFWLQHPFALLGGEAAAKLRFLQA